LQFLVPLRARSIAFDTGQTGGLNDGINVTDLHQPLKHAVVFFELGNCVCRGVLGEYVVQCDEFRPCTRTRCFRFRCARPNSAYCTWRKVQVMFICLIELPSWQSLRPTVSTMPQGITSIAAEYARTLDRAVTALLSHLERPRNVSPWSTQETLSGRKNSCDIPWPMV